MGVVSVQLPDELHALIERQVAEGRVASVAAFLEEAATQYADDLECDAEFAAELIAEAEAGIADIEAGRYRMIETSEDLDSWREEVRAQVREQLAPRKHRA